MYAVISPTIEIRQGDSYLRLGLALTKVQTGWDMYRQ